MSEWACLSHSHFLEMQCDLILARLFVKCRPPLCFKIIKMLWIFVRLFSNIKLELTGQARRHVDLGVEPLVGQQLWHSVQRLDSKCVVGVGEKIDHSHRSLRQAHLLGNKADAGPARLALPPDAPPARHAVGQICPASCVRWCGPFQDQCGLLQGVDQVSRRGGGPWRDESYKNSYLVSCYKEFISLAEIETICIP